MDARNKIEYEKTDKRNLEQSLSLKFSEFQSIINEEKSKYNEAIRTLESLRREFYASIEGERAKSNAYLNETKESTQLATNEKLERMRDDFLSKIREIERAHSDEVENRVKLSQSLKETTDHRIEGIKRLFDDELKINKDELRVSVIHLNFSSSSGVDHVLIWVSVLPDVLFFT